MYHHKPQIIRWKLTCGGFLGGILRWFDTREAAETWARQCGIWGRPTLKIELESPNFKQAPHLFDEMVSEINTEAWNKFKGGANK